jgi:hypothetical protein
MQNGSYGSLALPAVFFFLMGVGLLAWSVVMLVSGYRPPPHHSPSYGRGISGFASRARKVYAACFLVVCFALGCGLIATAVALLRGYVPQFLR